MTPGLAGLLGEVARSLQAETDPGTLLDELVAAAISLVPGAQDGSSVVVLHKQLIFEHPSSELVGQVDALQARLGEGPLLDAIAGRQPVRVPDMRHEQRWPALAPRTHELGVASVLSLPLYVRADTLGVLNLFSRRTGAFDEESEQIGVLLASHAAVAYAGARRLSHLTAAVASRDLIGQAKGILMQRYSIDQQRAFSLLSRISQGTHRKLHDVAEELVTTGRLPEPTTSGRNHQER